MLKDTVAESERSAPRELQEYLRGFPPESLEKGMLDLGERGETSQKASYKVETLRKDLEATMKYGFFPRLGRYGPFVKEVGKSKGARPTFGDNVCAECGYHLHSFHSSPCILENGRLIYLVLSQNPNQV